MKILVLLAAIVLAPLAKAEDHRSQWFAGGELGGNFASPLARPSFSDTVSARFPHLGAWLGYNYGSPEVSWELGYHYLTLGSQSIHTNSLILTWISRMLPESVIHPEIGFGVGWSRSDNYYVTGVWDTPIFHIRLGVDYELAPNTDLSFHLEHFTVFRNFPNEPNMHVLSPVIALTRYFGTSLQLPKSEPQKPAVAESPAPAPAPAAPAVSAEKEKASPSSASATDEKPKKKKKKRKKVLGRPKPDLPESKVD
jgi:hypothetical protein